MILVSSESFSPLAKTLAGAVCAGALFFFTGHISGQDGSSDLADLSMEQLMIESVTSVSKKETPLNDSAAAISVITADDINRFGIMSIPEALRLVPGMDVARIDGDHRQRVGEPLFTQDALPA